MMRRTFLLGPVCLALFAGNPKPHHLPTIDRLNDAVQLRFRNPLPDTLGMSRVAMPLSMGTHFRPIRGRATDFVPETNAEREGVASLEADGVQVGLYVVGVNTL